MNISMQLTYISNNVNIKGNINVYGFRIDYPVAAEEPCDKDVNPLKYFEEVLPQLKEQPAARNILAPQEPVQKRLGVKRLSRRSMDLFDTPLENE